MARDESHYQYDEYTTGRKQDYGHHELNEENGWVCYDWDRGEYTETMQMKKPLYGKGWKPFRIFYYSGCFEDFMTIEEAQKFFDEKVAKANASTYLTFVEVDTEDGEELRVVAKYPVEPEPAPEPTPKPLPEAELRSVIEAVERMQTKEQDHLKFLEDAKATNKVTIDIDTMIAQSKDMLKHYTTRLKEYKAYAVKHYGK